MQEGLVASYRARWMEDFGSDMIGAGLSLADLLYKSKRRMELVVRLMRADGKTREIAADMIGGLVNYGEAKRVILRRAPLSLVKSLRS